MWKNLSRFTDVSSLKATAERFKGQITEFTNEVLQDIEESEQQAKENVERYRQEQKRKQEGEQQSHLGEGHANTNGGGGGLTESAGSQVQTPQHNGGNDQFSTFSSISTPLIDSSADNSSQFAHEQQQQHDSFPVSSLSETESSLLDHSSTTSPRATHDYSQHQHQHQHPFDPHTNGLSTTPHYTAHGLALETEPINGSASLDSSFSQSYDSTPLAHTHTLFATSTPHAQQLSDEQHTGVVDVEHTDIPSPADISLQHSRTQSQLDEQQQQETVSHMQQDMASQPLDGYPHNYQHEQQLTIPSMQITSLQSSLQQSQQDLHDMKNFYDQRVHALEQENQMKDVALRDAIERRDGEEEMRREEVRREMEEKDVRYEKLRQLYDELSNQQQQNGATSTSPSAASVSVPSSFLQESSTDSPAILELQQRLDAQTSQIVLLQEQVDTLQLELEDVTEQKNTLTEIMNDLKADSEAAMQEKVQQAEKEKQEIIRNYEKSLELMRLENGELQGAWENFQEEQAKFTKANEAFKAEQEAFRDAPSSSSFSGFGAPDEQLQQLRDELAAVTQMNQTLRAQHETDQVMINDLQQQIQALQVRSSAVMSPSAPSSPSASTSSASKFNSPTSASSSGAPFTPPSSASVMTSPATTALNFLSPAGTNLSTTSTPSSVAHQPNPSIDDLSPAELKRLAYKLTHFRSQVTQWKSSAEQTMQRAKGRFREKEKEWTEEKQKMKQVMKEMKQQWKEREEQWNAQQQQQVTEAVAAPIASEATPTSTSAPVLAGVLDATELLRSEHAASQSLLEAQLEFTKQQLAMQAQQIESLQAELQSRGTDDAARQQELQEHEERIRSEYVMITDDFGQRLSQSAQDLASVHEELQQSHVRIRALMNDLEESREKERMMRQAMDIASQQAQNASDDRVKELTQQHETQLNELKSQNETAVQQQHEAQLNELRSQNEAAIQELKQQQSAMLSDFQAQSQQYVQGTQQQIYDLQVQLHQASEQLRITQEQLATEQAQLVAAQAQLSVAPSSTIDQEQQAKHAAELAQLQEQNQQLANTNTQLQSELTQLQEQNQALVHNITQLQSELQAAQEQLKVTHEQLSQAQSQLQAQAQQLASIPPPADDTRLHELQSQLQSSHQQMYEVQSHLHYTTEQLRVAHEQLMQAQAQAQQAQQQPIAAAPVDDSALHQLQSQLHIAETKLAQQQDSANLVMSQMNQRYEQLLTSFTNLQQRCRDGLNDEEGNHQRIQQLGEVLKQSQHTQEELQQEIERLKAESRKTQQLQTELSTMTGRWKEAASEADGLRELMKEQVQAMSEGRGPINGGASGIAPSASDVENAELKQQIENLQAQISHLTSLQSDLAAVQHQYDLSENLLMETRAELEAARRVIPDLQLQLEQAKQARYEMISSSPAASTVISHDSTISEDDASVSTTPSRRRSSSHDHAFKQVLELQHALQEKQHALQEKQSQVSQLTNYTTALEQDNLSLRASFESTLAKLKNFSSDTNMIERPLVVSLLVAYFERRDKDEVINLMGKMLKFTPAEMERINRGRQGVLSGMLGFLNAPQTPTTTAAENLADSWVNFLMSETNKDAAATITTDKPTVAARTRSTGFEGMNGGGGYHESEFESRPTRAPSQMPNFLPTQSLAPAAAPAMFVPAATSLAPPAPLSSLPSIPAPATFEAPPPSAFIPSASHPTLMQSPLHAHSNSFSHQHQAPYSDLVPPPFDLPPMPDMQDLPPMPMMDLPPMPDMTMPAQHGQNGMNGGFVMASMPPM